MLKSFGGAHGQPGGAALQPRLECTWTSVSSRTHPKNVPVRPPWSELQYNLPPPAAAPEVKPPKNGEIALWPSTNREIVHFLVLPGSLFSITEITEYRYFSPLKPIRECKYKSEKILLHHWILSLNTFCFCKTYYYRLTSPGKFLLPYESRKFSKIGPTGVLLENFGIQSYRGFI